MNCSDGLAESRLFALVCYVPDPLGAALNKLTGDFPFYRSPKAHITLLPPRPLRISLEKASERIRSVLRHFSPFEIELAEVECFAGTNVLYLSVSRGNDTLHRLHSELNRGELEHAEEFEFRPHLTLSSPIDKRDLEICRLQTNAAWGLVTCERKFLVNEVVLLSFCEEGVAGEWQPVWEQRLSSQSAA